jgi:hypothetical protein
MNNSLSFDLINGRFAPIDADHILIDVIHAKTKHHHNRISNEHLSEEDIKASEKRIIQLEQNLREALSFVREAKAKGLKVDMEASIHLKIV